MDETYIPVVHYIKNLLEINKKNIKLNTYCLNNFYKFIFTLFPVSELFSYNNKNNTESSPDLDTLEKFFDLLREKLRKSDENEENIEIITLNEINLIESVLCLLYDRSHIYENLSEQIIKREYNKIQTGADLLVVVPFTELFQSIKNIQVLMLMKSKLDNANIPYIIVEMSSKPNVFLNGNKNYEHIQTNVVSFNIENMVNYIVKKNTDYKKFCMCEYNVIFENDNWYSEISDGLEKHNFLQPFNKCYYIDSENYQNITKESFSFIYSKIKNLNTTNKKIETKKVHAFRTDTFDYIDDSMFDNSIANLSYVLSKNTAGFLNNEIFVVENNIYETENIHEILKYYDLKTITGEQLTTRKNNYILEWNPEISEDINKDILYFLFNGKNKFYRQPSTRRLFYELSQEKFVSYQDMPQIYYDIEEHDRFNSPENKFIARIKLGKFNTQDEVLILKLFSKKNTVTDITILVGSDNENKTLHDSQKLLDSEWITYNFIDPRIFTNSQYLYIYPINNIKNIYFERVLRNKILSSYDMQVNKLEQEHFRYIKPKQQIAIIADIFTYKNMESLFNLNYIPNDNLLERFDPSRYDVLFCESVWLGIDNSWKCEFNLFGTKKYGTKIKYIVDKFRSLGKKTIFYSKEDPYGFESFKAVSMLFDIVITTDNRSVEKYETYFAENFAEGKLDRKIEVMSYPFTINPIINNPMNSVKRKTYNFNNNILIGYPGSYFSNIEERCDSMLNSLDKILDVAHIDIYDRNFLLNKQTHQVAQFTQQKGKNVFPDRFKKYIKNCVLTPEQVNEFVYKSYKYVLNFNTIKDSDTMCSRRAIELAGCGTNIISDKSVALEKMYDGEILFFDKINDIRDIEHKDIVNLNLYYKTHLNYTTNNFMKFVFEKLDISLDLHKEKVKIFKHKDLKIEDETLHNKYSICDVSEDDIKNQDNLRNSEYHSLILNIDAPAIDYYFIEKFLIPLTYTNRDLYATDDKNKYFEYAECTENAKIICLNKYNTRKALFVPIP